MPALAIFVVVVAAVSAVVGLAARRTCEAACASADAEVLFTLAGNVLRSEHALAALLETFGQASVTLLEHQPSTPLTLARQRSAQLAGARYGRRQAVHHPDEGHRHPAGDKLPLALRGCRRGRWPGAVQIAQPWK
jgi:two-component system, OmpR family, sensor histidine kinase KdpD